MTKFYYHVLISLGLVFVSGAFQRVVHAQVRIDLAGQWLFQMDPQNVGEREQWFNKKLQDKIVLPGSMTTNDKGNDISVNTPWTGSIFDSSWFVKPEYAKYRREGNIKVPFWLQPKKYYVGAAWYQKEIVIPPEWAEKNIELFIERSHWETSLWIDGKAVGTKNSLSTAQVFDIGALKPGKHKLSIRVNNKIKALNVGPNSHSITDHTQTNWNGMVGTLHLSVKPKITISRVAIFPDISAKKIVAKIWVKNSTHATVKASVTLVANTENKQAEKLKPQISAVTIERDSAYFELSYPMGASPLLWDEFSPNLYSLKVELNSASLGRDEKNIQFGMKDFKVEGTQFSINGRKTFLRGTLESAIFPLTGYPATDTASWMRIFRIVKSHGLNHVRFHSWCPPEAAFDAADRIGIYLQVECGSWANWGTELGAGLPIDRYIYEESERIVKAYGNHPSFCMLVYGNEPGGKNHVAYLTNFVNYWKTQDDRFVYAAGAGWPIIGDNDFNNIPHPRIQQWEEELKSVINRERPKTNFDWNEVISKYTIPTVSHEIGQWCVYPDFKEMTKYTGVLQPKNFEIFRDRLKDNGLIHLADSFLFASGKLQALCYKADIEAALRTPGFGGFQLLDLHDFPGQGTALVGVLNPFWEEKGYITAKEFSSFCNEVVPLARFPKMVYLNNENLELPVEVSNFATAALHNLPATWYVTDMAGKQLFNGTFSSAPIPIGNAIKIGHISQSLKKIVEPTQLKLTLSIGAYQNSWDWFVYPAQLPKQGNDVLITQQLDDKAIQQLSNGGKVLLTLKQGKLKPANGGDIAIGFSSIFWNTAWTNGQAPHTLGLLVNPKHVALKLFPTDYHSNYQWWDAMSHSNAVILDSVAKGLKPIVRVIDDWVTARSLGLVFECMVGNGKLMVSSIDLISKKEERPEARQLMYSLLQYMQSNQFNPETEVPISKIKNL